MNDIKKIQEFFSKSLEEATFKVGDKVTYLGHPGEITGINKEMTGAITYNVAYDKGDGRTKATNIDLKSGAIKLAEAEEKYTVAGRPVTLNKGKKTDGTDWTVTFKNGKSKPLSDVLALIKPMPKGITMNEAKETGVDMAKKQLDALGVKYEMSKTDKVRPFKVIYKPINKSDEFYDKFEDIVDLFNLKGFVKSSIKENNSIDYTKLISLIKSANNPRNLPIYYNSDNGVVNIGGVGYDKGELVKMFNSQPGQSLDIKNLFYKANQNPEETKNAIESMDPSIKVEIGYGYGNEPFVKYIKSVNESNGFKSGKAKPYKPKYNPMASLGGGKGYHIDEDKFDDKITNLKKYTYTLNGKKVTPEIGYFDHSLKAMISTPRSGDEYFDYEFYRIGEPDESGNIELSPEKGKKGMYTEEMNTSGFKSGKEFINIKLQKYPKAVAKINQLIDMIGEDKFTMEMAEWLFDFFNNAHFESPMNEATKDEETEFHKKLDKLVHDTFGKRKGELEEVNLKQAKLSSAEYQKAKKLKDFKASDWKWNADEDLYTKVNKNQLKEYNHIDGQEDNIEENVAPNHDGKAAPFGSGYKPLEEKIAKALDQINEELCPAGKAYIKRRQAAGEKSSAYLSGRGVKVCKGQMSGKAKKK
jgi:hypothetical protein